jgi:hypothetical protein
MFKRPTIGKHYARRLSNVAEAFALSHALERLLARLVVVA